MKCSYNGAKAKKTLFKAIEIEQMEMAELLISNGWDVNTKIEGITALHKAVMLGNDYLAKYLIKFGADINVQASTFDFETRGFTPLHFAAKAGHHKMIELLLANNADINAKDT